MHQGCTKGTFKETPRTSNSAQIAAKAVRQTPKITKGTQHVASDTDLLESLSGAPG